MNNIKQFDRKESYVSDVIAFAIGLIFLLEKWAGWKLLYFVVIGYSFYSPTMRIWRIVKKKKEKEKSDYFLILFDYIFGIVLLTTPARFVSFTHIFFGWWMLGHGIILLVRYLVERYDENTKSLSTLLGTIFSMALGVFMIFSQKTTIKTEVFSILAGIYFIIYGILSFLSHFNQTQRSKGKASFTVAVPVLLNAFTPLKVYLSVADLIKQSRLEPIKPDKPADVWVYIYLKGKGPEAFGHLDLSYKGVIYSYGNHDPQARKLMEAIGDGVIIEADEKLFLQQSMEVEDKMIIGYGIQLTDEEKKIFEKRLEDLRSRYVVWKCDAQLAKEAGKDPYQYHDYASRVYQFTNANMYKFTKGKFKTYFVCFTNCVLLADYLIRNKNLSLVDLSGVVTPGAYLSFLNSEYLKDNSCVTSRVLYEDLSKKAAVN